MKDFSMRKKKSHRGLILVSALAILVFVTLFKHSLKDTSPKTDEVSTALETKAEAYLEKKSAVILKNVYDCGHIKTETQVAEENITGKTKEEISRIHPDWEITDFSENLICAQRIIHDTCSEHFVIKLKDDTLFVFKKNNPNEVIKKQKINTSMLLKEEIQELKEGIDAQTQLEVLEILESFVS